METSIFKNAMQECETAIRNLKQNPQPKDIYLIGELVNLWLKNFNLCTILNHKINHDINTETNYETKEN